MHQRIAAVGLLTLSIAIGGCRRDDTTVRGGSTASSAAPSNDRASELQRQREEDLSKMDVRVAAVEREYQEQRAERPSGTAGATATAGLRNEVKSDVSDVRKAVDNLRTTTPENWWDRHMAALRMGFDDVESDVKRFTGTRTLPGPPKTSRIADASGEPVSTEPFTSSRDKFVADMQARVGAMKKALDNVKASGPRKTELDDLRARVNKLGDDIDSLKAASAEDWWALSKARVSDYLDRVEKSVGRLDDNKR
jgi:hypothetical protein